MNDKRSISVDDAYDLETPEDSIRLYADWAGTYDSDFVSRLGYVYHRAVAEQLIDRAGSDPGAVLDVGCGTGVVGVVLREAGVSRVDGIDISVEMLAEARRKTLGDGSQVYDRLINADLTLPLDIPDNQYAAIVSAGTFTHGHLGPGPLDELWRIAQPGATCVIGVNAEHYATRGFAEKFAGDVARGRITEPTLVSADIYSGSTAGGRHARDRASIAVCRVI